MRLVAHRDPLSCHARRPAELLRYLSRLLAAERRRRGTPSGSRKLTCRDQAILALRWFRDRTHIEALGGDHGVSRATAYRYVAEAVDVLSERAPGLAEALERAMAEGVPYVILDGVNGQVVAPAGGQVKVPTPSGWLVGFQGGSSFGSGLAHAVGVAAGDHDVGVVEQPVEEADGGGVLGQEAAPLVEWPVAGDAEGAALVGGGDEPEQQLGAGVVEGGEPDFVDQDEVVAEQVLDDLPDAVVGQAAVEGVGEVGGGEVADPAPGVDGGDAEGDQDVAFPGAGRPDQAQVLRGGDPFQGGEVVQGGARDGRRAAVEFLQGLEGWGLLTGHQRGPRPGHTWGLSHGHGQGRLADRDRGHRGSMPPPHRRPPRHRRREMGTGRCRGGPHPQSSDRKRRLRGVLAFPPRTRAAATLSRR